MRNVKHTGARRFRAHARCFRKPLMVLQVQVQGERTENNGGVITTETDKWWKDAQLETFDAKLLIEYKSGDIEAAAFKTDKSTIIDLRAELHSIQNKLDEEKRFVEKLQDAGSLSARSILTKEREENK